MVLGNLMAIPQRNVKRMLAYSSIAHAGYTLLGVAALFVHGGEPSTGFNLLGSTPLTPGTDLAALRSEAVRSILFYLLSYTVSAVGAFGVISALERREDEERGTGGTSTGSPDSCTGGPGGPWRWRRSCCRWPASRRWWGSWASCWSSGPRWTPAW